MTNDEGRYEGDAVSHKNKQREYEERRHEGDSLSHKNKRREYEDGRYEGDVVSHKNKQREYEEGRYDVDSVKHKNKQREHEEGRYGSGGESSKKRDQREQGQLAIIPYAEPMSKIKSESWSQWVLRWLRMGTPVGKGLEKTVKDLVEELRAETELRKSLKSKLELSQKSSRLEVSKLHGENDKLSGQIGDLWEKQKIKDLQIKSLKYEIGEFSKIRGGLNAELREEREYIKTQRAEINAQKAIVAKAQATVLNTFSETVSSTLPDDVVERRLRGLLDEAQDWARDNSIGEGLKDRALVKEELINKGFLVPNDKLEPHEQFDMSVDYAADTILETLISHELCNNFLQNPYFLTQCIYLQAETHSSSHLLPVAFQAFEEYVANTGTQDQALAWREKTVLLLNKENETSESARNILYKKICHWYLENWAVFLVKELEDDEKYRLLDIVTQFGNLAVELWSLKREIKIEGLNYFGCSKFRVHSREMMAATILHLPEGKKDLDGRKIAMVTQPMIVSYLKASSDSKSKGIIWAKGVVWVSDKEAPVAQMIRAQTNVTSEGKNCGEENKKKSVEENGKQYVVEEEKQQTAETGQQSMVEEEMQHAEEEKKQGVTDEGEKCAEEKREQGVEETVKQGVEEKSSVDSTVLIQDLD